MAAIIAAAAEQLRTVGYEGLTTIEVAKAADVSIGTLYQFFDNKDDLMAAIAEKHVAAMRQFRGELFGPDAIYVPAPILVSRTVDWLVDYNTQNPTFNQIFSGLWTEPALLQTLNETTSGIANDLATILRHHAPDLPPARAQLGASVLVYVIKGMLGLLEAAEPAHQPALLAEVKRMSLLYFNDLVTNTEAT